MTVNCHTILIYCFLLRVWGKIGLLKIKALFGASNGVCDISLTGIWLWAEGFSYGASARPLQYAANGSSWVLNRIPGWRMLVAVLLVPLQAVRWEQWGPELGRPSAAAEASGIAVHGEGKLFDQHIFLIGSWHPGVFALPQRRLLLHLS